MEFKIIYRKKGITSRSTRAPDPFGEKKETNPYMNLRKLKGKYEKEFLRTSLLLI